MSRVFTPFPSSRLMNFLSFRRFDLIRWGLVVVLLAALVVESSRSLLNAQSLDSGGLAHDTPSSVEIDVFLGNEFFLSNSWNGFSLMRRNEVSNKL